MTKIEKMTEQITIYEKMVQKLAEVLAEMETNKYQTVYFDLGRLENIVEWGRFTTDNFKESRRRPGRKAAENILQFKREA